MRSGTNLELKRPVRMSGSVLRYCGPVNAVDRRRAYLKKWLFYQHNALPWNRLALHRHFMRHGAFLRWPVYGNVLKSLDNGRLELSENVLFEPGVWISITSGRLRMAHHSALNRGVFISATELIEIGAHSKVGNWAFVTDGEHRHSDLTRPFTWQGMRSKGPTVIGENVWVGVGSAILGGLTVGDRSIIGANSVVTKDVPPYTIAAGAPARVVREIDFEALSVIEAEDRARRGHSLPGSHIDAR
jgi:acetyltransferase-like isoleucine patch superfamily enzyme